MPEKLDPDVEHVSIERWRGRVDTLLENTQKTVGELRTVVEKLAGNVSDTNVKLQTVTVKVGFIVTAAIFVSGIIGSVLTALFAAKFK